MIIVLCLCCFIFFLDVVNSDCDSASTEANNSDPSSAKADGQQANSLERYSHGSTEASSCSSSIEIDDRDNAEQGSAAENDYSGTDSENNIVRNFDDSYHKFTLPSTPLQKSTMTAKRSPLADLLVYPTPTQKVSKAKSCARVLTSAESIAMLEEKARKKERSKKRKNGREERES